MLARAERELGLDSKAIVFQQSKFNYPVDQVLLAPGAGFVAKLAARWRLLWIALSYDVIHYNFGESIMPSRLSLAGARTGGLRGIYRIYVRCVELLDVRLLKALGKGIVVTYQGDDARQGGYCRKNFAITFANEVEDNYYTPLTDRLKRERIERFARYADRIHAYNPDLLCVLPRGSGFLPYPFDLREWRPMERQTNPVPVIVHAPSHRGVKGTRFILEAVEILRGKGMDFEFVLVEGLPQQEARKHYERADLLVDQLLAGWYGGLAVELMALGKPVICYIREQDLEYIPGEMRNELPVINATPATVAEVMEYWLTKGLEQLPEVGEKSRRYVERWHDSLRIAETMKREYEDVLKGKSEVACGPC